MADRQSAGGAPAIEVQDEPSRSKGTLPDRDLPDIVIAEDSGEHGKTQRFRRGVDDAIAAAQRDADAAKEQARQANERAANAERQAAAATHGATRTVADERLASVESQLGAAKTAMAGARAKLRTAIEQGDADAIADAQAEIGQQAARLEKFEDHKAYWEGERERAKAAPAEPTRTPQWLPVEEAWIAGHPLFNSDPEYKSEVIGALNTAMARGMLRGGDAAMKFMNERMAKMYGDGHGKPGEHGKPQTTRTNGTADEGEGAPQRQTRGREAWGMPRSMADGGAAGNGASLWMDTDGGRVTGSYGADGKLKIQMSTETRRDWEEAASWCNMTLAEYAADQLQIASEERAGKDTGLRFEGGRIYR